MKNGSLTHIEKYAMFYTWARITQTSIRSAAP
jgi:hypothetical protein